nr:hypothetical transcript [Hymenolepis microstoma]
MEIFSSTRLLRDAKFLDKHVKHQGSCVPHAGVPIQQIVVYIMKFLFNLLVISSVLVLTTKAQVQYKVGCTAHTSLLLCNGEQPYGDDLQSSELQTIVMSKLPEGTWLSLENPQMVAGGVQKIAIEYSSLAKVEPGYFESVSGRNKLKRLEFRNVKGPLVVDKNLLKGLEKSLNYLTVLSGLKVNIADLAEIEYLIHLDLISTTIVGTLADFEKLFLSLRSLEIKNCNVNQLPWDALAKWLTNGESKRLKIHENEWMCDCSMIKLKHLQPGVIQSDLQKMKCVGPQNPQNKQLSELTEKDLCPVGEPELGPGSSKNPLEASGSTSGDGQGGSLNLGGSGSNGAGGLQEGDWKEDRTKESGIRTEVIIAGAVVGVLVLAFAVFLIIYKYRLYPKSKSREERASRTHQNKRYVNVIEEPPLQQFEANGRAKENGKYSEGAPV